MRRKIILIIAVAAAVLAAASAVVAQGLQRFPDVPPEHEAFEAVEWAAEVGVTTGYTDGTFKPELPLSKRHAVVFMERYYDEILGADQSEDFTRGDMMVLLKAINDGADTATTTQDAGPRSSTTPNLAELSGHGPGTTQPVTLGEGVWDITIEVAGQRRPSLLGGQHPRPVQPFHRRVDHTTNRAARLAVDRRPGHMAQDRHRQRHRHMLLQHCAPLRQAHLVRGDCRTGRRMEHHPRQAAVAPDAQRQPRHHRGVGHRLRGPRPPRVPRRFLEVGVLYVEHIA